jgi:hypothetical protein
MRLRRRVVQVAGMTFVAALVVMGPAVATSAQASVSVIPGGPPIATAGAYSGSGTLTDITFCSGGFGIPTGIAVHLNSSGSFSGHPSLGDGTYEFHVSACDNFGQQGGNNISSVHGTFVLDGSQRFFSGELSGSNASLFDGVLQYTYVLKATGICRAIFRATGQGVFDGFSFDESGILEQLGGMVCVIDLG